MIDLQVYNTLSESLKLRNVTLVAVSKKKPASDIQELYDAGQRDFGENYVQELVDKQEVLPKDIRWHFIGHLQRNKVKYIAPFVTLIHAVDSFSLLEEINKQAAKNDRVIDALIQLHIAKEETKFGADEAELKEMVHQYFAHGLKNVRICGLMGMSTNTENLDVVKSEFEALHQIFNQLKSGDFNNRPEFNICSMGMSGDYELAIASGSNLVRIGSLLFGARQY